MIETALAFGFVGLFLTTIGLIAPVYYKLGKIETQLKNILGDK